MVNRETLIARISAAVAPLTVESLSGLLDAAGVPNSPLLTVDQVTSHPQTAALGMLAPCAGDELALAGIPLSFGAERPRSTVRAPGLGEHNSQWKKTGVNDEAK